MGERRASAAISGKVIFLTVLTGLYALYSLVSESLSDAGLRKQLVIPSLSAEPLLDTFQPYLLFRGEGQFLADLWRSWNKDLHPFPKVIPPYQARWSGEVALPRPGSERKPGLEEAVYKGSWVTGHPLRFRSVHTPELNRDTRRAIGEPGPIAIEWMGYLNVPTAGEHTFYLSSDDGSMLWIDGALIVDNWHVGPTRERSGAVALSAGEHRIRLRYFDQGGDAVLQWSWLPPGSTAASGKPPVPSELLSHAPGSFSVVELGCNCKAVLAVGDKESRGERLSVELAATAQPGTAPFGVPVPFSVTVERARAPLNFSLRWRAPDGSYTMPPRELFRPLPDFTFRHTHWKTVALLGAVLAVCALTYFRGAFLFPALAALVVCIGFSLRWYQYDLIPYLFDTADELNSTWIGFNLLLHGAPAGWTFVSGALTGTVEQWLGQFFFISPNVFHPPPFYSLLAGGAAWLAGARTMYEVEISAFRLPSVFLSSLTAVPLMLYTARRAGPSCAVLAGLVFATLPAAVMLGRLNKEEVPLALIIMCSLVVLDRYLASDQPRPPWRLLILVALGAMVKEVGACVGLLAVLACWERKRFRAGVACGAAALAGELVYTVFCLYLDKKQFLHTLLFHAQMVDRTTLIQQLFFDWRMWHFPGDGWLIWLWFASCMALALRQKLVWTAIAAYLIVFYFLAVAPLDFPWYRIPLIPLLSIGGGIFLYRLIARPELSGFVIFSLCAIASSLQLFYTSIPIYEIASSTARPAVLLISSALVIIGLLPRRGRSTAAVVLIAGFLLNCVYTVITLERTYPGNLGGSW